VPLLQAKHLAKYYGSGRTEVRAVDDVSLRIEPAEMVLIMGPSGSGKTTLLSMLGGLLRPTKGIIEIAGVNITAMRERELPAIRASKVGFIFQAFNLLDALTVEENILFPARLNDSSRQENRAHAGALLERLGLAHRRSALPRTLSGGEKQRVAIARALINRPPLILADEPTGNLDSHSGQEVMMILHDIARDEGRSIVLVTHDPRVEDVADRILWLEDGSLRDRKQEQHAWVTDPVCGMRVDAWTAVLFAEHRGERYTFCSQRCKERFEQNPGAYGKEALVREPAARMA
jgi:putative ABC transport system ATP-binding protein